MDDVIHLNTLLVESAELLEILRSKQANLLNTVENRRDFNQRYADWCNASCAALPDDLRVRFEEKRIDLLAVSDTDSQTIWSHYRILPYDIEEQQKQLFIARRRLWQPSSSLPKEVRSAIAAIFRNSYEIYTINKLFVDSGCEQHWYVPSATQDTGSKALSRALGWIDGILLYAPEQEQTILYRLCERILDNKRLSAENREHIERILPLFQAPAPSDPLVPYNLHPAVHTVAAPLVAIAHYDDAILKACIALNNAVQSRVGRSDLDGSTLMQQVFSSKTPILTLSTEPNEQLGWMQLFSGAIQALRNPRAHKLGHATSLEEAIEWLCFLSALFRALDRAS